VKFRVGITMDEDGGVKVESANPGAVSPWEIIGILEYVKTELLMTIKESEEKTDDI